MRSFRYTNSKGARISLGANSIPSTLEDGLVGCWPMENISEYPTGTATYFQDAWATTDGWFAFNGGSISVSGGLLTWVRTGTPATFQLRKTGLPSYGTSSVIKMRLRLKSGSQSSTLWTVGNLTNIDFALTTSFKVVSVIPDMSYTSLFLLPQNTLDAEYEIDWIYIGDGSYAANSLIDNSGNGNHYRIFGSTPTTGLYGNGLSRDGINDYERSELVLSSIPDVWHIRESRPVGSASLAQNQTIFNYGVNTGAYLWIYRESSTDTLRIGYFTTVATSIAFSNYFTGFSSSRIDVDVTVDWVNRLVTAYRNGVQFGQTSIAGAVKPSSGSFAYYGAYQGTAHFSRSTVDERREYSRAPSLAEVNALYTNRAAPFVATGETAYGIIESVEGIDSADADIQATRAPLQDGQTYIDSLFDSREVVVRGSIMVPKNLDTIYARRKIILDALNPKYGNGTLDFFYGANTINHRVLQNVVVEKVQFPNKPFQNPFQEFQITFRANDPYFYEPLTDTHGIQILSGESRTFTVGGEQDTPVAIRIYGAATNPSATNSTAGETIALTYSLAGGSYIDIDTRFGSKTIKLNGATSLIGNLNIGSSFWNLRVGSNTVSYTGGGYVILLWRERYIGV